MNLGLSSWMCVVASMVAGTAVAQGVYTCTDAKGRRITADRPIPECVDREQRVLNSNGTVKERIGPTLTAEERARKEEQDKRDEQERLRQSEAARRERALLVRFPNQAAHDRSRADALSQIELGIRSGTLRQQELQKQRDKLNEEMEFHQKDPSKAPANLRAQLEENAKNIKVQEMFIYDQELEQRRVNQRFDEELYRLRRLWGGTATQ